MMASELTTKSHEKIAEADVSEAEPMLGVDYGLRVLCGWMRHKFGIETTPDEFREVEDRRVVADTLFERAEQAYNEKEAEYPVLAGISNFSEKQGTQITLDREGLVEWIQRRFGKALAVDDVRMNREDLKNQLIQFSRETGDEAEQQYKIGQDKLDELFGDAEEETTVAVADSDNNIESLMSWLTEQMLHSSAKEDLSRMNREELSLTVQGGCR